MAIKSMSQRYVRPDIVRRINAMGDAAGGAAAMVALDADELLETARTAERYDGDGQVGDGDWLGRFERLTAGLHATDMHVTGRLMTRVELIRSLRARFRLAAAIDATPAMADEVIVEPIGGGLDGPALPIQRQSAKQRRHQHLVLAGALQASSQFPGHPGDFTLAGQEDQDTAPLLLQGPPDSLDNRVYD